MSPQRCRPCSVLMQLFIFAAGWRRADSYTVSYYSDAACTSNSTMSKSAAWTRVAGGSSQCFDVQIEGVSTSHIALECNPKREPPLLLAKEYGATRCQGSPLFNVPFLSILDPDLEKWQLYEDFFDGKCVPLQTGKLYAKTDVAWQKDDVPSCNSEGGLGEGSSRISQMLV
eukprot:TRINITY_DN63732_c0_g1_i1.p1 TRINITY_DN63732_c0_g1~~TRINITY_DN63732_c0_g1_i1.p1  ORF type:complete len:186 (+),score=18.29 TRINITY_DN63732_c0_g1_i1:47-559(+)